MTEPERFPPLASLIEIVAFLAELPSLNMKKVALIVVEVVDQGRPQQIAVKSVSWVKLKSTQVAGRSPHSIVKRARDMPTQRMKR
jgi:hypothetical protein